MSKIDIENNYFTKYISKEEIEKRISLLSNEIDVFFSDESKDNIIISILNGSFIFTADIVRQLSSKCKILFIKLKSYSGTESTGIVKTIIGLDEEIKGKNILVVEDIIDSGKTIKKIYEDLQSLQPASIKIATLLLKPNKYKENIPIDIVGFKIEDDFVIGYGLDINGYGRNLKDIFKKTLI
ncbi:MAG: hypoxanthine phosphoribosyltransferase [Bacteroidetes bacterium GWE2_29_8]|nr:MAG: hypoxanthine phosphoribosyltransferase [Bacteroidetes bacterium GWE2_29_8]OFY16180.1 MAG: hypoxanthine phosphoribosyltransferase [Bacteroidetes bacterium GWF2_29_10]